MSSGTHPSRHPDEARRLPAAPDSRWFQSMIEHSWDVIKLIAPDGTILYASPAARRVLHRDPDSIVGMPARDYLHPDDVTRVMTEFAKVAATDGDRPPTVLTYRCNCGDGSYLWMEGVLTNLLDEPEVGAIVLNERDVTDRKRAQQDREELLLREQAARAQAEAAVRAKDTFLSVVSHELRTPLTPVLLCVSDLQRDANLSDRAREELAMIREQVELEAQIIDDLLDLTRIGQGHLQLSPEPVDAHAVLRAALATVDREVRDKQIDLRLDLSATLTRLRADPRRLRQVFWNVLSNAVKFTPAGGAVTVRSEDAPGSRLRVSVTDTGVGFRPEFVHDLFRPFEQAEQSLKRRFGGLGLGLTIARELVDLHHGTITASSPGPDRGATFTLEFPASLPTSPLSTSPLPHPPPSPRHLHILLVEDNSQTLSAMTRILTHAGHRVSTAVSIGSALCILEEKDQPVDLLVCDIGLPDGSGWELLRRSRPIRPVPAIALSGFGSDDDLNRSRRAGFSSHLVKPVTPQKLLDAIRRATPSGMTNSEFPNDETMSNE